MWRSSSYDSELEAGISMTPQRNTDKYICYDLSYNLCYDIWLYVCFDFLVHRSKENPIIPMWKTSSYDSEPKQQYPRVHKSTDKYFNHEYVHIAVLIVSPRTTISTNTQRAVSTVHTYTQIHRYQKYIQGCFLATQNQQLPPNLFLFLWVC